MNSCQRISHESVTVCLRLFDDVLQSMKRNNTDGIEQGFVRRYDARNPTGSASATFIAAPYLFLRDSTRPRLRGSRNEGPDKQRVKTLARTLYDFEEDHGSSFTLKPESKLYRFQPIYVAQVWFLLLDPGESYYIRPRRRLC